MGVAGEMAAERAAGPGSLQVAFLDVLAALTPEELDRRARVEGV
jgi:hydroxyethylthiazole kinase